MSNKASIAQRVLARIKEDISSGAIKDGEIITERSLEGRYNVSRTPIKEALKLLEVEGWVEITPRQETRVVPFGIAEIQETLPIRVAIEGVAIKLCIQNLNPKNRVEFTRLLSELEHLSKKIEAGDDDVLALYNTLDNQFHTMIFKYSKNRMLRIVNYSMRSLAERTYRGIPLDMDRIKAGSDELKLIIQCILSGNSVYADFHITSHIINSVDKKVEAALAYMENIEADGDEQPFA